MGKKVFEQFVEILPEENTSVSTKEFSKGIHIVRVFTNLGISNNKVVLIK
jgi:hypothetical protein